MHNFDPETKRTHPIHVFGPNSDVLVRFCQFRYYAKNHVNVAFNAPIRVVNETMHNFDPETKRMHTIHIFGPNSDVLVRFGQFRYSAKNHANVAFNAPIRLVNETMHSFGPETKRTHPIHVFEPNSDVLVHFGLFCYSAKNHVGVAFNAPIQVVNETTHSFGPKRNERTQSTFLDPIVMFWFVLVSFVTVQKTMQMLHLMHPFGSLTKRRTISIQKRNERTESTFSDPIVMFCFVLVSFVTVQKNHANIALNAPIRVVNETTHSFDSETKRTHPIHVVGPNSDVLVRFGQFHYCAKNHANVAFNAPIRVVNETVHSFGPETKRTHPIHVFGPNSDVLVRFGQFCFCAKNHANVAFNAPIQGVNETMHSFGPETKRTLPIHVF